MGWLNGTENICWLCSGGVKEPGLKVDIREETGPNLVADAADTKLEGNRFDYSIIDPPYSRELVKPGGSIITLSYETPKIPRGCDLLAVCGESIRFR